METSINDCWRQSSENEERTNENEGERERKREKHSAIIRHHRWQGYICSN